MGYGLPAAIGAQIAHPNSLVIDIAGEASILMNIQEMSTAIQYRLPVKVFILNNQYMGMVRQWQELLHGGRYSESYTDSLPDFVKLAEAYGAVGIRCSDPADLDRAILEMIDTPRLVLFDCVVDQKENCFPMIPSGRAHNEMILAELGDDAGIEIGSVIDEKARCWFKTPLRKSRSRYQITLLKALPMNARTTAYPPSPYSSPLGKANAESHTLSVLVDNEPGVLARVVGLFSARSFNIESLTVARGRA